METSEWSDIKGFTTYIRQLSRPKALAALDELPSNRLRELMDVFIREERYELCGLIKTILSERN